MDNDKFSLALPLSSSSTPSGSVDVPSDGAIVIVGANGSGKTRLGTWIESKYGAKAHRISAQKSLQMPEFAITSSVDRAMKKLLYGHQDADIGSREGNRWQRKPNTNLLNDYQSLVEYLSLTITLSQEDTRTQPLVLPTD